MSGKPNVVVLGGVGFIGRNLVEYLADNGLVNKIRVADKVLPDLACLSKKQQQLFKSDKVEFKQANLAREAMVNKVFEGEQFDIVFNVAGETKLSQTDEVYKENIIDLTTTCAKVAASRGVKKFVEVSTAQVYDAGKKPSPEGDKLKPWTKLAKAKLDAEAKLREVGGLDFTIVRPAIVYGPGDISGITPRIICAAVYKQLGEPMEFLWDDDLKINTVHVRDVVAALWHVATAPGTSGKIFNLADSNDTDQGKIGALLESIFKIKTKYMGNIQSKLATSIAMKTVAETANEKHLKPWSDLCKTNNILNTPLTPYLDEELLYNNSLSVDGHAIAGTGFAYKHPKVTEEAIREVIQYFVDLDIFPKSIL